MSKTHVRHDLSCTPIEPRAFYALLAKCLEKDVSCKPQKIVSRPFPALDSNFRDNYLLKEVLRKYPDFDLGIDTSAVALAGFISDEAINAETNERLSRCDMENPYVRQVFSLACRKAVTVLGKFRPDWWLEGVRFGPGATTRISGETANSMWKLSGTPHVTSSALNLAQLFFREVPQWHARLGLDVGDDAIPPSGEVSWIDGGRNVVIEELDIFMTVPKNAVTDRTIGIAPCMNIAFQLGVGYHMRKRMYPYGINLNDQSINQRRAREGSINGRLATLDLKSASNSMSMALVWQFIGNHSHNARYFDPTWYNVLTTLRTEGCIDKDGIAREYNLFSAMGNGFTFELESLIFWSIAAATCEILNIPADVTVYGDDLIVPVESVELLVETLAYCGFRINEGKSFWTVDGPLFRESCGVHYLDGCDVTPFYIDAALDRADQIILLANNIVRWCKSSDGSLDGRLLPLWEFVVSHLSKDYLKFGIPFSDANDGLIMSFDSARPSIAYFTCPKKLGAGPPIGERFIGYRVNTVALETKTRKLTGQVGLTVWLYEAEKRRFTLEDPPVVPVEKLPHLWEPGVSGRGCVPSTFARPRHSTVLGPEKAPLKVAVDKRKKSLQVGSRVVRTWPLIGPWVCLKEETLAPLGYIFRNPEA